jgi:hypothetical protein
MIMSVQGFSTFLFPVSVCSSASLHSWKLLVSTCSSTECHSVVFTKLLPQIVHPAHCCICGHVSDLSVSVCVHLPASRQPTSYSFVMHGPSCPVPYPCAALVHGIPRPSRASRRKPVPWSDVSCRTHRPRDGYSH